MKSTEQAKIIKHFTHLGYQVRYEAKVNPTDFWLEILKNDEPIITVDREISLDELLKNLMILRYSGDCPCDATIIFDEKTIEPFLENIANNLPKNNL